MSWEPVHLNAPCRRFVSASKDGDARIWDVSLKKCIILSGHTLAVTCVKWGGDGVIYTGYFSFFHSNFFHDFSLSFSLHSIFYIA
jgi:WD40 repeat protein